MQPPRDLTLQVHFHAQGIFRNC